MHLTSLTRVERLRHLWLAPFTLHQRNLAAIANEAAWPAPASARVIAKVNALVDEATINALYEPRRSVRIDLIVRGACSLRPGVKDFPRTSRCVGSRSLSGAPRIYYYGAGGSELVYLASADWMGRTCSGVSRSRSRCWIRS